MLYTVGYDFNSKSVLIKDTDDGVVEALPLMSLGSVSSELSILGVYNNTFVTCEESKNFIMYPNTHLNKLVIYDKNTGLFSSICGDSFKETRNTPHIYSVRQIQFNSERYEAFNLSFSVKYDIEFTGNAIILLDTKTGGIVERTDIFYVLNDKNEVETTINLTQGDCPKFISEYEVPFNPIKGYVNNHKFL